MAKEFINPNWHVLLIHFPLGLFIAGMLIELLSFMYRRSAARSAGRWMILIGALAGIPTALSGIYAFANVARMELPANFSDPDQPWVVIANATQLSPEQWEHLRNHVFANSVAAGVAVLCATIGLGCSDRWRRKLYVPLMLGLLFSLVAMAWGAWHGGEMVYRHGTAVLRVEHQGATADASQPKATESAADEQAEIKRGIEFYVPPLQLHVVLAGVAVAFAFAALGLSMRAIATSSLIPIGDEDPDADAAARAEFGLDPVPSSTPKRGTDIDVVRSLNPVTGVESEVVIHRRLPVSRFWVFAALLGVCAALAGMWFLGGADESRVWEPKRLWSMISPSQRRLWHVITGVSIVVVPLLLAVITRVSRRPKALLTLLSLVLVAAVALQVWLGVLLMFDTPDGTIRNFNTAGGAGTPPATSPSTPPAPATQGIADVAPQTPQEGAVQ